MEAQIAEPQKMVIKFPAQVDKVDLAAIGAAFTKWIQDSSIPGTLIDVADYSHMFEGPGVILVAHEYIISLDQQHGVDGLRVAYRLNSEDSLADRIQAGVNLLNQADELLKADGINLNLNTSQYFIGVADRLNVDGVHDKIHAAAKQALGDSVECVAKSDTKDLPGIQVKR